MLENRFRNGMNWNLIVWWTRGGGGGSSLQTCMDKPQQIIHCLCAAYNYLSGCAQLPAGCVFCCCIPEEHFDFRTLFCQG